MGAENQSYGPGFLGFVVIFLLAVAVWLLLRDFTRRMRRLRYSPDPNAPQRPSPEALERVAEPEPKPGSDDAPSA